ncbi:HupE/UreJ family protein [Fulvivirga sediminis]|uniref:HupE/UreJ family protein n=1 Tax=Fulvivirga sediminis TaxID=2803949 RepID=A0A937F304_9BACT|nr:HupE/UreJ family protein [Fulvivirga sediminis]MBL3654785.1 HupE/UreJ family protein [Fulvivirga sediminis]
MTQFQLYFELGLEHILDINGYDHIIFVIALCAIYLLHDWKRILVLITAFTIGHSITLALSTLKIVNFDSAVIEFLIPVTIFLTAMSNILKKEKMFSTKLIQTNYLLALFFGLIHGLGFSNYLKSLLGQSKGIVSQLFAFNIGLEVGQIIVVAIFLLISFIFVDLIGVQRRDWRIVISSAVAGIALMLMFETKFW